jgi:hypothetical protein
MVTYVLTTLGTFGLIMYLSRQGFESRRDRRPRRPEPAQPLDGRRDGGLHVLAGRHCRRWWASTPSWPCCRRWCPPTSRLHRAGRGGGADVAGRRVLLPARRQGDVLRRAEARRVPSSARRRDRAAGAQRRWRCCCSAAARRPDGPAATPSSRPWPPDRGAPRRAAACSATLGAGLLLGRRMRSRPRRHRRPPARTPHLRGSETLLSGGFLRCGATPSRLPDGSTPRANTSSTAVRWMVVPLLDDGRLVLVRQYRYPLQGAAGVARRQARCGRVALACAHARTGRRNRLHARANGPMRLDPQRRRPIPTKASGSGSRAACRPARAPRRRRVRRDRAA